MRWLGAAAPWKKIKLSPLHNVSVKVNAITPNITSERCRFMLHSWRIGFWRHICNQLMLHDLQTSLFVPYRRGQLYSDPKLQRPLVIPYWCCPNSLEYSQLASPNLKRHLLQVSWWHLIFIIVLSFHLSGLWRCICFFSSIKEEEDKVAMLGNLRDKTLVGTRRSVAVMVAINFAT